MIGFMAFAAAIAQIDVSSDGDSFKRSQLFDQLQTRLTRAETAWYTALTAYQEANGLAPTFFAFGVAAGCRGR